MNAYQHFSNWLKAQPIWLQDAAWKIYHNQPIGLTNIKQYADFCMPEGTRNYVQKEHLDYDSVIPKPDDTRVTIKSMSNIVGVNALSNSASLDFYEKGVTVVYGLNGAGKSGYMRILKKACGHPYAEAIQPNVYKSDKRILSCTFEVSKNDETHTIIENLIENNSESPLRQCDVFDSIISSAYVEKQNNVVYEPFAFKALATLANIAEQIKVELDNRKAAIPVLIVNIPSEFDKYSEAVWLYTLNETSVIPMDCLQWTDADDKQMVDLKKMMDVEEVKNKIKEIDNALLHINSVVEEMTERAETFAPIYKLEIRSKFNVMKKAHQLYINSNLLFNDSLDKIDLVSLESEDWKILWKAARSYYESFMVDNSGQDFGTDGSICPLCHQSLPNEVRSRFVNIDEYFNGSIAEKYENSKKEFDDIYIKMASLSTTKQIEDVIIGFVPKKIEDSLVTLYTKINKLIHMDRSSDTLLFIDSIEPLPVLESLTEYCETLKQQHQNLCSSLDFEKKITIEKQIAQMDYRKWVFDHTKEIQQIIGTMKKIKKIDKAYQFVTTNKITTESNYLANELLTDAYINRFTNELSILAPEMRVCIEKGASQKGKSPYKVVLDTSDILRKKPEIILSEGEQRIVALATFFADATGRSELGPIIIDDPISSLDCNYEERSTRRIVLLAKSRQVIIFTHRISLLVGMREECSLNDVEFSETHIRSTGKGKGVLTHGDEYTGDIRKQLNAMREQLTSAKKLDKFSAEYVAITSRLCQQFRIAVERSIEDILLMKMVRRFERNIKTLGKLNKLALITADDCKTIDNLITKYSFTEHSQPEDSGIIIMRLEEIDQDILDFIEWIKVYNKKVS